MTRSNGSPRRYDLPAVPVRGPPHTRPCPLDNEVTGSTPTCAAAHSSPPRRPRYRGAARTARRHTLTAQNVHSERDARHRTRTAGAPARHTGDRAPAATVLSSAVAPSAWRPSRRRPASRRQRRPPAARERADRRRPPAQPVADRRAGQPELHRRLHRLRDARPQDRRTDRLAQRRPDQQHRVDDQDLAGRRLPAPGRRVRPVRHAGTPRPASAAIRHSDDRAARHALPRQRRQRVGAAHDRHLRSHRNSPRCTTSGGAAPRCRRATPYGSRSASGRHRRRTRSGPAGCSPRCARSPVRPPTTSSSPPRAAAGGASSTACRTPWPGHWRIKNGWTAIGADGNWHLNCLAISDDWILTVMTRYPAHNGLQYGADVCAGVARPARTPKVGAPHLTPEYPHRPPTPCPLSPQVPPCTLLTRRPRCSPCGAGLAALGGGLRLATRDAPIRQPAPPPWGEPPPTDCRRPGAGRRGARGARPARPTRRRCRSSASHVSVEHDRLVQLGADGPRPGTIVRSKTATNQHRPRR